MPPRPRKAVISRKEIGQRLRLLRAEQNLSQSKLARILGTHQTNISEMERGVRGVTVQQLVRLSRVLGVSPNALLGVEGARAANGHPQLPPRFLKRLQQVATLPRAEQQALIKIIDRMVQANQQGG